MIHCKLCNSNKIYKSIGAFGRSHLPHNHPEVSSKNYYDKFLKNRKDEGLCVNCRDETTFHNINKGYYLYCKKCKIYSALNGVDKFGRSSSERKSEILKNRWKEDLKFRDTASNNYKKFAKPFSSKDVSERNKLNWTIPEYRDRMSKILTGNSHKGHFIFNKDIYFHSSYEAIFYYKRSIINSVDLIRCSDRIKYIDDEGKDHFYTPDFYEKDTNTVYEIKAQNLIDKNVHNAKTKIEIGLKYYGSRNVNYVVITEKDLFSEEKTKRNNLYIPYFVIKGIVRLYNEDKNNKILLKFKNYNFEEYEKY